MSNVPKLRFSEFSGEWEEKKLKELTQLITKGTTPKKFSDGEIAFVKIEALQGININKQKCLSIDEKTHTNELKRSILQENDILFAIAGSIGKVAFVTKEILPANTNQALAIIRLQDNDYLNLILQILQSKTMKIYIQESISVGAQPNLNLQQMGDFRFFIPEKPEQTKIASFLTSVDTKIEHLTKKETLLKEYKKGVMAQIFNQEIRFKADDGSEFPEWEGKKIKEIFEYKNGGSFENDVIEDGSYNLITLNSIDITGELKNEHKKININNNSLNKNDLIMVLSDVAHGNFLGLVAIIPENNKYVLNQRMGALKQKTNDNISFIRMYINHNQKYFKLHGQGSSQQNLSKGDIEKFIINLPSLPEQTKIANFLSSIDTKIELTTKELNSTKEYKKALLQQMFV